ncbi:hypothetical protein TrLO_g11904 [Triparma laevis f. longispina]|uniref:Uncharacterized protein n=1 Tax=Triparma laevis f. longispina TaxID=1714387 RepID=A0A9W7AHT0_9STRA|nr:hypothetical protein TrLO_g11904 [Triparma laevis f. longispina]
MVVRERNVGGSGGSGGDDSETVEKSGLDKEWMISFTVAMSPFCGFCYAHQRGLTLNVLKTVYRTVGVYGFFALPFITLAMEKSVYDSVQAFQGKEVENVDYGQGENAPFPSGGGKALPSFSLIAVRKRDEKTGTWMKGGLLSIDEILENIREMTKDVVETTEEKK